MNKKTMAGINFYEKPGAPGGPCVLIFHGYGADAADLASLANLINSPKGTTWLFPNGTLEVPIGPHMYGRAWFPIDMAAIEKARMEGRHRDLSKETPGGLKKLKEQFHEVLREFKIPFSNVILGGFSQGAMLAAYIALHSEESPKGLILWSGNLLDEKNWRERAKLRKGLKFYQSHGEYDDVLSLEGAKKLNSALVDGGLIGNLTVFDGGHEIPQEVISETGQYLSKL